MPGLMIPKDVSKEQMGLIAENSEEISAMLDASSKRQISAYKKAEKKAQKDAENVEKQRDAEKKLQAILTPPTAIRKMRDKLTKIYHKHIVKGKFLKKIGGYFKTLIQKSGSWLMNLLKLLLFFAIFDPKNKFLKSILGFITKMVVKFVNIFIKMVPGILRTMWELFWGIIVPGMKKMGKAIGVAIFGKDSIFASILEFLGGLLPIAIVFLGLLAKLPFLQKGLMMFGSFLSKGVVTLLTKIVPGFMTGITIIGGALAKMGMALLTNPITWVILAIVAALALLYKFAEPIVGFFEGLWDKFKKLGTVMKIVVGAIALIFLPLSLFVGLIFGLVKLFKAFKKHGVKKTLKLIWKSIKKFGKDLWKNVTAGANRALRSLVDMLYNMFIAPVVNIIKGVSKGFTLVKDAVGGIIRFLKDKVIGAFFSIRESFSGIGDWLKAFALYGLDFVTGGEQFRERAVLTETLIRRGEEAKKEGIKTASVNRAVQAGYLGERKKLMAKLESGEITTKQLKAKTQNIQVQREVKYKKSFNTFKDKKR